MCECVSVRIDSDLSWPQPAEFSASLGRRFVRYLMPFEMISFPFKCLSVCVRMDSNALGAIDLFCPPPGEDSASLACGFGRFLFRFEMLSFSFKFACVGVRTNSDAVSVNRFSLAREFRPF